MLLGVPKTGDKRPRCQALGPSLPCAGGNPESQLRSSYQRKLPENNALGLIKAQRTWAISGAWGQGWGGCETGAETRVGSARALDGTGVTRECIPHSSLGMPSLACFSTQYLSTELKSSLSSNLSAPKDGMESLPSDSPHPHAYSQNPMSLFSLMHLLVGLMAFPGLHCSIKKKNNDLG